MKYSEFCKLKVGDYVRVKTFRELVEDGWTYGSFHCNCMIPPLKGGLSVASDMYSAFGKELKIIDKVELVTKEEVLILDGFKGFSWTCDMIGGITSCRQNNTTEEGLYNVLYRDQDDKEITFKGELIGGDMCSFTKEATWVFLEEDNSYRIIPFSSIIYMEKL